MNDGASDGGLSRTSRGSRGGGRRSTGGQPPLRPEAMWQQKAPWTKQQRQKENQSFKAQAESSGHTSGETRYTEGPTSETSERESEHSHPDGICSTTERVSSGHKGRRCRGDIDFRQREFEASSRRSAADHSSAGPGTSRPSATATAHPPRHSMGSSCSSRGSVPGIAERSAIWLANREQKRAALRQKCNAEIGSFTPRLYRPGHWGGDLHERGMRQIAERTSRRQEHEELRYVEEMRRCPFTPDLSDSWPSPRPRSQGRSPRQRGREEVWHAEGFFEYGERRPSPEGCVTPERAMQFYEQQIAWQESCRDDIRRQREFRQAQPTYQHHEEVVDDYFPRAHKEEHFSGPYPCEAPSCTTSLAFKAQLATPARRQLRHEAPPPYVAPSPRCARARSSPCSARGASWAGPEHPQVASIAQRLAHARAARDRSSSPRSRSPSAPATPNRQLRHAIEQAPRSRSHSAPATPDHARSARSAPSTPRAEARSTRSIDPNGMSVPELASVRGMRPRDTTGVSIPDLASATLIQRLRSARQQLQGFDGDFVAGSDRRGDPPTSAAPPRSVPCWAAPGPMVAPGRAAPGPMVGDVQGCPVGPHEIAWDNPGSPGSENSHASPASRSHASHDASLDRTADFGWQGGQALEDAPRTSGSECRERDRDASEAPSGHDVDPLARANARKAQDEVDELLHVLTGSP